ncbi:MAG: hypothetical protein FI707_11265 [SAR202 cluster bacterium]|mgnify:FL=1|nr:hypothetical protein [Chloroflexota bacterium]MDP6421176.1 fused MFS/spermidine synthase [SAR202 cluster bacterium]HAL46596.1 hypothetical protein [Dehalococcoidia bacterium]MDP6663282.1 fused MFS/spermidine synthase [SAR202 cluster bacterium]MDP6800449.1 fused MFS/spermidine synthase [SAR202 cluster bacterium]
MNILMSVTTTLRPYLIVFTASACGLIIEIVAGRILAPTIGVSLYTWTSIIGIVLAGISIGAYLGGRVADRFPSSTTLGVILLAGGVASMSILPLVDLASDAFRPVPLLPRIVLLTAALFFLPSLILGMVTPVVIKLNLRDLAHTGNVVGKIYAVSTAGSIFGTFITGFVLIQLLGTRSVVMIVSFVLIGMAFAFGSVWRAKLAGLAMGGAFAGVVVYSVVSGALEGPCVSESNYFCIKVRARDIDGREVRVLSLDALVHSYVDVDDPMYLKYSYEKVFADIATFVGARNPAMNVLFIGGGGYTMPRFLEVTYPESSLEVAEIDPEVTLVAADYLGLSRRTRIVTHNQDARTLMQDIAPETYDLIIGDAFNDVSVPYHLATLEFDEAVLDLLTPDGIYAVNIVDRMHSGRFLRAFEATMKRVFPYVYVLRDNDLWTSDERYTFVVIGSRTPLSHPSIATTNLLEGRPLTVLRFMPSGSFRSWSAAEDAVVLTDDFVPVDGMLAPLFFESR